MAKTIKEVGIVVPCHITDMDMLPGCLESLSDHYPELSVCLIPHGYVPIRAISKKYGASIIDKVDVDPRLQAYSYGYGLTKMIAFWHAPFEYFLHVDPDAVAWGSFLTVEDAMQADFTYNNPHEEVTPFILRTQYFNPDLVPHHYLPDHWASLDYFQAGTFFARRGLLDLDEYIKLRKHSDENPGSLFTDQGILNIMIWRLVQSGKITAAAHPLQVLVPLESEQELDERFKIERNHPLIKDDDKRLIHWAGKKPRTSSGRYFRRPMDFYRLKRFGLENLFGTRLGGLLLDANEWFVAMRIKALFFAARHFGGRARARLLSIWRKT